MNRYLSAALYVLAAGGVATLAATLTALAFPPSVSGLVFVAVALTVTSLAGALTPRNATPYTRQDNHQ